MLRCILKIENHRVDRTMNLNERDRTANCFANRISVILNARYIRQHATSTRRIGTMHFFNEISPNRARIIRATRDKLLKSRDVVRCSAGKRGKSSHTSILECTERDGGDEFLISKEYDCAECRHGRNNVWIYYFNLSKCVLHQQSLLNAL